MNEQEFKQLVDKYLAGTCTPEEKQLLEKLDAGFDTVPDVQLSAEEQQHAGERVWNVITTQQHKAVTRRLWWGRMSAAAAVALVLWSAWWLLIWHKGKQETPAYAVITTAVGQQKTVQLPDGSVVMLNAASKLSFPRSFTEQQRVVVLEGEAFFSVQTNPAQPFLVKTGSITTRVLGTSFNVKAYPGKPVATISLATGKVQVSDSAAELGTLLPGAELVYDNRLHNSIIQHVPVEDIALWQKGTIVCKQLTLEELAFALENNYGVHIRFDKASTAAYRITGRFQRNTSITEILDIVSSLNHIKYTQKGNDIMITHP